MVEPMTVEERLTAQELETKALRHEVDLLRKLVESEETVSNVDLAPKTVEERLAALEQETKHLRSEVVRIRQEVESKISCETDASKGSCGNSVNDAPGFERGVRIPITQVSSIDEVNVGDVVERQASDTLNLTPGFLRSKLTSECAGNTLVGSYWWPCVVTNIKANGDYHLHYFGYGNDWDHWIFKNDRHRMLRPVQVPSSADVVQNLVAGGRVEVRIYQDTHIYDANSEDSYFWVAGTILSTDGKEASVKLDAESFNQCKIIVENLRRL